MFVETLDNFQIRQSSSPKTWSHTVLNVLNNYVCNFIYNGYFHFLKFEWVDLGSTYNRISPFSDIRKTYKINFIHVLIST
jgi:hypothetical protein